MLVKGAPCVHTVQLLDCGLVFSMGTTNDDSHTANGIFENENIESAMLALRKQIQQLPVMFVLKIA